MKAAELLALDGLAQAELVRGRQVSVVELVDAAISRIEALNPILNCVVIERFEQAREDAERVDMGDGRAGGVLGSAGFDEGPRSADRGRRVGRWDARAFVRTGWL